MQHIDDFKSGKLIGAKKIKLSCHLTQFPNELFTLTDTLEVMDLSNNRLSVLPEDFGRFKKLKIAFFSDNLFTQLPQVLSQCPNLEMIGFKSNQISIVPENALPKETRWLILTNNLIEQLPKSIGNCYRLQKVALAGNRLTELPQEMEACKNLELLRISANNITQLPSWLFNLPKLTWLAYSGNPCGYAPIHNNQLNTVAWNKIELKEQLGEGASGIISKAQIGEKTAAVKIFKGEVTSDGLPEHEMNASIFAGNHPNLVEVLGKVEQHPENKNGLVLSLIPPEFKNLGNPPSFETCTRDTFDEQLFFTLNQLTTIALGICSAMVHIHSKGIMHGDLYAHNILINEKGKPILGDFGAATLYHIHSTNATANEKLDVRAFGCLLEDLLNRTKYESSSEKLIIELNQVKTNCMNTAFMQRPNFAAIELKIKEIVKNNSY